MPDADGGRRGCTPRRRCAHHFDNLEQQNEASTLGMWVFLATEVLFFGGLFVAYVDLPRAGIRTRSPRPATTSTSRSARSTRSS